MAMIRKAFGQLHFVCQFHPFLGRTSYAGWTTAMAFYVNLSLKSIWKLKLVQNIAVWAVMGTSQCPRYISVSGAALLASMLWHRAKLLGELILPDHGYLSSK